MVEAVQQRLDKNPEAMRTRRETVEHPFGTLKMRMGATHFLCKTLPKVATEMALCVLAYNLTRVLNIVGVESSWRRSRGRCASPHTPACCSGRIRTPTESPRAQEGRREKLLHSERLRIDWRC